MLFTSLPILALEDIGEWDLPGEKIIYVSPNGSDDGDGSEAKPYRTLGAADKAVGDIISGGAHVSDITVYLGGGVYQPESTIELTNGGNAETEVAYRAKDGEQPIICGGTTLSADKFYKPEPEAVARIKNETARGAVVAIRSSRRRYRPVESKTALLRRRELHCCEISEYLGQR